MSLPPEFSLIARHFRPLAGEGALGLLDDAALLTPAPGEQIVLSADAMVAGVHFLPEDSPETIGRKLLRVNLSDLAAMGASPLGYLMTIALTPATDEAWLAAFVAGLAEDQREFGVQVLGGDTVSTPGPLTLSLTILGSVPAGAALRRVGARPGDDVWVSGCIGDGYLGLRAARGDLDDPGGYLAGRYRLPTPRLALGQALRGLARACLDVSDGLLQDLSHLCRAGGCAAEVQGPAVPVSRQDQSLTALVTGGDDYELLFAASPEDRVLVEQAGRVARTPVTRIGRFTAGAPRVTLLDAQGHDITPAKLGWSHL